MNVKKCEAGEVLFQEGELNHLLCIIAEGKVSLRASHTSGTCDKGCILGIPQSDGVFYPFTCTAETAVTLYQYDYQSYDDLNAMLATNQDACGLIACCVAAIFNQQISVYRSVISSCQILYDTICEEYDQYKELCEPMQVEPKELPGLAQLSDLHSKTEIDEWTVDYYASVAAFSPQK